MAAPADALAALGASLREDMGRMLDAQTRPWLEALPAAAAADFVHLAALEADTAAVDAEAERMLALYHWLTAGFPAPGAPAAPPESQPDAERRETNAAPASRVAARRPAPVVDASVPSGAATGTPARAEARARSAPPAPKAPASDEPPSEEPAEPRTESGGAVGSLADLAARIGRIPLELERGGAARDSTRSDPQPPPERSGAAAARPHDPPEVADAAGEDGREPPARPGVRSPGADPALPETRPRVGTLSDLAARLRSRPLDLAATADVPDAGALPGSPDAPRSARAVAGPLPSAATSTSAGSAATASAEGVESAAAEAAPVTAEAMRSGSVRAAPAGGAPVDPFRTDGTAYVGRLPFTSPLRAAAPGAGPFAAEAPAAAPSLWSVLEGLRAGTPIGVMDRSGAPATAVPSPLRAPGSPAAGASGPPPAPAAPPFAAAAWTEGPRPFAAPSAAAAKPVDTPSSPGARPDPATAPWDVEEVLDALTREMSHQFRRFYGA